MELTETLIEKFRLTDERLEEINEFVLYLYDEDYSCNTILSEIMKEYRKKELLAAMFIAGAAYVHDQQQELFFDDI